MISNYLGVVHCIPFDDNIILLGVFNYEPWENVFSELCEVQNLKTFVQEPTCYKNPINTCCIHLIHTNRPGSFQKKQ